MHAHPSSPTQSDRAAARAELRQALADPGYAFLASDAFSMTPHLWDALAALRPEWCDLPLDSYLADNGRYRYRRHGRFSYCPASRELEKLARTPYFQASYVNRFAGGVQRNFAPLSEATFANPFLHQIIRDSFDFFPLDEAEQARSWITDVHLVRVCATSDEAGKPTPEGIHCDGFRYVSFHLIERMDIRGGESRVYDLDEHLISSRTLVNTLDSCYADDHKVLHEVTPITPDGPARGHRDMLLLSFV